MLFSSNSTSPVPKLSKKSRAFFISSFLTIKRESSFLEEKMYVENLLFENAEAINIANFVTNRNQNTIKVSLKGIRDCVYYLTKTDKEAIVATFNLSVVLADCYKLEQERTFVLHEIEKLKKRIR